jgi:hypothetical protein
MARKSKAVSEELKKAQEKARQIEQLLAIAEKEEAEKLENATQQINEICEANNLFCGIVLTTQDLLGVIQLALESNENVTIPFRVYHAE